MKKFIFCFAFFYSIQCFSACDLNINPTQDIQTSLNSLGINKTLCLSAGIFNVTNSIHLQYGQRIAGLSGSVDNLQTTIQSSANVIILMEDNTTVDNFNLRSSSGNLATFGVLSFYDNNPVVWNLNIKYVRIGIGVNGSTNAQLLNNYLSLTGDLNNGGPDPSIWIKSTQNTKLWYGYIVGRNNGVRGPQGYLIGDGEVGCYDSTGLTVTGTRHDKSGTSSFYLVNCDNATLDGVRIFYSNGYGLDIVNGTDNFVVKNSKIYFSKLSGSVYDEIDNNNGTYNNNIFYNNNTSNESNCSGISVIGNPNNLNLNGNTVLPSSSSLTCSF